MIFNGRPHGPFATYEEAAEAAKRYLYGAVAVRQFSVRVCGVCGRQACACRVEFRG